MMENEHQHVPVDKHCFLRTEPAGADVRNHQHLPA